MNTLRRNPRIEEVIEEVVEDLAPYLNALVTLAHPATAAEVAAHLERDGTSALPTDAVRRRLDQLVEEGRALSRRTKSRGRPYRYEHVEP